MHRSIRGGRVALYVQIWVRSQAKGWKRSERGVVWSVVDVRIVVRRAAKVDRRWFADLADTRP